MCFLLFFVMGGFQIKYNFMYWYIEKNMIIIKCIMIKCYFLNIEVIIILYNFFSDNYDLQNYNLNLI